MFTDGPLWEKFAIPFSKLFNKNILKNQKNYASVPTKKEHNTYTLKGTFKPLLEGPVFLKS